MDKIEIHYKKQEGGYRLWVMSMNPKCISANCQEIKTAYRVSKTDCLRLAYELSHYYQDDVGKPADIVEF